MQLHTKRYGFTLIELLIAISIMAILSVIVFANMSSSSKEGRDAKRQADLTMMKTAIEQYRARWGRYPDMGCTDDNGNGFSDEGDTNCVNYITGSSTLGSSFAPDFIPSLPHDPARNGNEGYAYIVNPEGTVYKLMAMNTVESEKVGYKHLLRSCNVNADPNNNDSFPNGSSNSTNLDTIGLCAYVNWNTTVPGSPVTVNFDGATRDQPDRCKVTNDSNNPQHGSPQNYRFEKSYGVWGGYAGNILPNSKPASSTVQLTSYIICH